MKVMTIQQYLMLPNDIRDSLAKSIRTTCKNFYDAGYSICLSRRKTELALKVSSAVVLNAMRGSQARKAIKKEDEKRTKVRNASFLTFHELGGVDVLS